LPRLCKKCKSRRKPRRPSRITPGKSGAKTLVCSTILRVHRWETEYKPFSDRRYSIDYADPKLKIAVEYEGGVTLKHGGAHRSLDMYLKDVEKYNLLAVNGWLLLRFTCKDKTDLESVEKLLVEAIRNRSLLYD
jgi:very-short-patch-repair endonuclease